MRQLLLPDSVPAGIQVWCLDIDLDAPPDSSVLSPNERMQAARFHQQADQARFVKTRAGLRRLLAGHLGRHANQLDFLLGPYGKPMLSEGGIDFNVAHAGNHSLIALSRCGEVGVDVERCDDALDIGVIATYAFTDRELESMSADLDGIRQRFFRSWVGKEAVLKALGLGIADHLQSVSVFAEQVSYKIEHAQSWPHVQACLIDVPKGYMAALAWQSLA